MKAGRSRAMGRSSVPGPRGSGGSFDLASTFLNRQAYCVAQRCHKRQTHCSAFSARNASITSRPCDTFKRNSVRQGVVMILDDHGEGFERHPAVSPGQRYVLFFHLERPSKTSSEFMNFFRKERPMMTFYEKWSSYHFATTSTRRAQVQQL